MLRGELHGFKDKFDHIRLTKREEIAYCSLKQYVEGLMGNCRFQTTRIPKLGPHRYSIVRPLFFVSRRIASRINENSDLKKALVISLRAGYTSLRDKKTH